MMGPLSDLKPTFILSKGGSDRPAAILIFRAKRTSREYSPGIFIDLDRLIESPRFSSPLSAEI